MTTAIPQTKPDQPTDAQSAAPLVAEFGLLPITLRLPEAVVASGPEACEEWFWEVCLANPDVAWQMELTCDGELELMPPTDAPSDLHENRLSSKLYLWDEENGYPGEPTGPTAAYRLPNNALRVPDAAWTLRDRVLAKTSSEPRGRPYCPDFVVEIRSTSQRSLTPLLAKMQEYWENGAQLGWLIDPLQRTVRIYHAGADEPELLADPETLDGGDLLPGFTFAVRELIFDLT
jgi:Uma2 family endonuclease